MKQKTVVFFFMLFVIGCGNKNSLPDGIMQPQQMKTIVRDLMRADDFVSGYLIRKDSSLKQTTESLKLYNEIFAINKTSRNDFKKSFDYYTSHPDLLKQIMDSINVQTFQTQYPGQLKPAGKDSSLLQ